ncbi:MAG: phosphoribosyltransferase, partial [Spirochaetes bacterium]|nr:phosphoribosyltransferase [Spirochaetota bacterium]
RIFEPRQYTPKDPKKLLNALENRNVVIVEDILTTGGSVAKFQKTLNHLGIPVRGVVSLLGNSRLRIDEKTSQTLRSALTDKQIQIKDSSFIEGMTRTEAGFLIRSLNQVKSEKKIKEFSDKFLKLVDSEKSKADKLKSIRFDHNLKNITTNINTSDNTSNFSHKELLKQFSGQVIENQKNKLDSQKEKLAIIAFQGMKIRVEFSSQKDRGQFIKNSIFSDIAKVTHIDDALIAATLNNTIIKSGKDINETDKRLSNSFDQFKSIDPEKHSFMMLTKKDYSKPVIFDLKSHSAREAVLKQIDVLRIEDLKATRLNNFNNITIKASREGQIVTTNIKDALRTKILSFQQEQKANMSKTPDLHQVKKPATKKDNIDMGLSR